jgi:hypothetical protein
MRSAEPTAFQIVAWMGCMPALLIFSYYSLHAQPQLPSLPRLKPPQKTVHIHRLSVIQYFKAVICLNLASNPHAGGDVGMAGVGSI